MKIAIIGSSGLIGTALVAALRQDGDDVLRLVRRAPITGDEIRWDPAAPGGGLEPGALDGVGAVVNLAGAGVADHRWPAPYKEASPASPVTSTRTPARVRA